MYIHWLAIGDAGQYFAIVIADDQCDDRDPRYYGLRITLCPKASTATVRPNPLGSIR
jgi:hypothetical protein